MTAILAACLGAQAHAGPLEKVWAQCVLSDRPHHERVAALEAAGWIPMDEKAANYAAHGTLFARMFDAPLSDLSFWNNVEPTFVHSTKFVDVYQKMILDTPSQSPKMHYNLQKDGAVLRLLWQLDDPKRETHCSYQQPEEADPAAFLASMGAPLEVQEFSIGTVSDLFIRMQNPQGEWSGTNRVLSTNPDIVHLRSLAPGFRDIGFTFSSFLGIWE